MYKPGLDFSWAFGETMSSQTQTPLINHALNIMMVNVLSRAEGLLDPVQMISSLPFFQIPKDHKQSLSIHDDVAWLAHNDLAWRRRSVEDERRVCAPVRSAGVVRRLPVCRSISHQQIGIFSTGKLEEKR
jgi:hypothetical protein